MAIIETPEILVGPVRRELGHVYSEWVKKVEINGDDFGQIYSNGYAVWQLVTGYEDVNIAATGEIFLDPFGAYIPDWFDGVNLNEFVVFHINRVFLRWRGIKKFTIVGLYEFSYRIFEINDLYNSPSIGVIDMERYFPFRVRSQLVQISPMVVSPIISINIQELDAAVTPKMISVECFGIDVGQE